MADAAHGAALLEADGLVTEKSAGWRFEASGAKGGAAFNPLEGWYPDKGAAVAPSKFDHAALGDKAWKYDVAAAEELKAICAKSGWPLWDMFTPAYDWLFKTGLPSEFYSRDYVHSGELGKQIIGRIALGYFVMSAETP